MGRMTNFPLLLDSCLQITTGELSKWGYFKHGHYKSGTITWTRTSSGGFERKNSVSIYTRIDDPPFLMIEYSYGDQDIAIRVALQSQPSNLGKGLVWYFHCPDTGRRCRKLYLVYSRFVSRYAVPEAMYESQTVSKKWRFIDKHYGDYFKSNRAYEALWEKNFKRYYKGKPTKKYKALMDVIERAKSFTDDEIQRLYLM